MDDDDDIKTIVLISFSDVRIFHNDSIVRQVDPEGERRRGGEESNQHHKQQLLLYFWGKRGIFVKSFHGLLDPILILSFSLPISYGVLRNKEDFHLFPSDTLFSSDVM